MLNTIYSEKEYMAQGFTKEEVSMIKRHDELFNKSQLEGLTSKEEEEMCNLITVLKI